MIKLLNLDNDVLNMIKTELEKLDEREKNKIENFKYMDEGLQELKQDKNISKNEFIEELKEMIYDRLYKNMCSNEEITEYIITRNLKSNFSKNYRFFKK